MKSSTRLAYFRTCTVSIREMSGKNHPQLMYISSGARCASLVREIRATFSHPSSLRGRSAGHKAVASSRAAGSRPVRGPLSTLRPPPVEAKRFVHPFPPEVRNTIMRLAKRLKRIRQTKGAYRESAVDSRSQHLTRGNSRILSSSYLTTLLY